jgi:diguanylate cyclase (GGDEF)-like protein/PAS domain S-box-containing protein
VTSPNRGLECGVDVLVVDDDEGVRSTIVDILTLAGFTVAASASAAEAEAAQLADPARVAVVDYRLPDTTGLELATRLKQADPDLPVIVLTGNASLETAVAAVGTVDEYLTKPVPPARLLQTVRAGLERRRLLSENRELLARLTEANLTLEARVRERTEQLRADRERLAEAQRTARIGSWEWDFDREVLTTSTELRRLCGVDPGQELGSHEEIWQFVSAEDQARIRTTVLDAIAEGRPFDLEVCLDLPGGEQRWLRVQGRVQARGGDATRLAGTAQDVTDRKQAEAQFQDLLESAPDAMVIADEDGRIVLANRQVEVLFGWPRRSLVGRPVETLLPERLREPHEQHRVHYHRNSPQARPMGRAIELAARRADGGEFPVEVSLSPVQTADGVLVCAAIRDVTERKEAERVLAHQALHDALTGLPNRVLLVDRLEQALARTSRGDEGVAVLFLDIDRFKVVNDSRGHAAGDELIVGVADRLRATIRPTDTVARFGGDEFVVVYQEAESLTGAMAVADRIVAALREPFRIGGEEIFLTVSVGIAVAGPGASSETLLRNADAAMYRAKEQGRARCEFFDETMQTEAATRLELQTALNWAVQREEMRVFYQPLINIASGTPVGIEALLRWQHPDRGIVAPADFIPLAEDAGLIVPIGRSVLDRAAADFAALRAAAPPGPFSIAVNLSAHQLRHPGLVEEVRVALAKHELAASSLCMELTESALLEDLDRHLRVLMALRDLGVRLALDDFGTGFSSLTYLKRFPVDMVKIDRSFVAGLGVTHCDTAIVRSVIELAHALNLTVVAEGIERPEQLEELRSLGCDLAQGYLFAPALPQALLLQWLGSPPGRGLPDRQDVGRGYEDIDPVHEHPHPLLPAPSG